MMLVYVVTASASAISAALTIATSPLVGPPLSLAAANDGTSAPNAEPPASAPAPAAAVRPRNCLRSVPSSSCLMDMNNSPSDKPWLTGLYAQHAEVDHVAASDLSFNFHPGAGLG
jgi:hypothetical protein